MWLSRPESLKWILSNKRCYCLKYFSVCQTMPMSIDGVKNSGGIRYLNSLFIPLFFQKMTMLHETMEDLDGQLGEADLEMSQWPPVGDIVIENLQDEIDKTKVTTTSKYQTFVSWSGISSNVIPQCNSLYRLKESSYKPDILTEMLFSSSDINPMNKLCIISSWFLLDWLCWT